MSIVILNSTRSSAGTVAQRRCPMVIGHSSVAVGYFTGYVDNVGTFLFHRDNGSWKYGKFGVLVCFFSRHALHECASDWQHLVCNVI